MADVSKAVLITGCSSGIGRATAKHLAERGWTVYATARRAESIEDLPEYGCSTLALDVTDEDSMKRAVEAVEAAEGAVGVLVNNAGYSQSGAVETVPLESMRRQFETNVFGLVRMFSSCSPGCAVRAGGGSSTSARWVLGGGPEVVARKIEKAVTARRPKTRYPVTPSARLALGQPKLLTDRMWDRAMRVQFPRPGAG